MLAKFNISLTLSLCREGTGKPAYRCPRYSAPPTVEEPRPSGSSSGRGPEGPTTDSGADQPSEGQRKRARMESESDSGVIHARPLESLNKYNRGVSLPCEQIFGPNKDFPRNLLASALSNSTWRSMESVWNNFFSFEKSQLEKIVFPLKQNTINMLISWLLKSKNLRYSSIVAYINSLTSILTLKGLNCENLKSYATKIALKGCKNLEFQTNSPSTKRKVMTS